MKYQATMLRLFALTLLSLALPGCASWISNCETEARDRGNNEAQVGVICEDGANKYYFMREVSGQLFVRQDLVSWKDLRVNADKRLKDLEDIQDAKFEENRQFNETYPYNEEYVKRLEHIEKVRRQIYRMAELNDIFEKAMGKSSEFGMPNGGYSAKKIALPEKLIETFPFTDDKIEAAKKEGTLKVVDSFTWTRKTPYFKKAVDPLHPDDENEFVWKPWGGDKVPRLGLDFMAYKIVTIPKIRDVDADYVEGYVTVDGKAEPQPVLRAFFPTRGAAIVVIYNREQDLGLSLPAFVDQMMVSSLTDIGSDPAILAKIFPEKPEENRVVPPKPDIKVDIARHGDVDLWEKAPAAEGWKIEFVYKNERKDNFYVWATYKKMAHDVDTPPSEISDYMAVESIAKVWTGSRSDVVEYFHPKPPFDGKSKATAFGKNVSFEFENGERTEGAITNNPNNKFIEDQPYAIVYSPDGGTKWLRIEKDSGSQVFNKRKEVGKPQPPENGNR